ncbi:hypothetical protein [uncultured Enterovirga sp.]|uniref:hypothetical protein n=1 Tax=uncultured Enterovirga sp. TaxID=2026352 RepID=UPI0035CB9D1C
MPIEALGLLGEHVVLLDLTPEQLLDLSAHDASAGAEIPSETEIRIGIVKPFH